MATSKRLKALDSYDATANFLARRRPRLEVDENLVRKSHARISESVALLSRTGAYYAADSLPARRAPKKDPGS